MSQIPEATAGAVNALSLTTILPDPPADPDAFSPPAPPPPPVLAVPA